MNVDLKPPFNVFAWSLAIFLIYALIQATLTVAYSVSGYQLSPAIAIFNWFAVCCALSFTLYTRYKPQPSHMAILQAFSCFYIIAISLAVIAQSGQSIQVAQVGKFLGVSIVLYAVGALGFYSGKAIRKWKFA